MARVLIVGCGCRGQALARDLRAAGHAVRGTTRDPARADAIAAAGAEPYVGDPDRIATLMDALAGVTILCWLMGTATGRRRARRRAARRAPADAVGEARRHAGPRGRARGRRAAGARACWRAVARSRWRRTRPGGSRSSCSTPTPPTTSAGARDARLPRSTGCSAVDRTSPMDPDEIEFSGRRRRRPGRQRRRPARRARHGHAGRAARGARAPGRARRGDARPLRPALPRHLRPAADPRDGGGRAPRAASRSPCCPASRPCSGCSTSPA